MGSPTVWTGQLDNRDEKERRQSVQSTGREHTDHGRPHTVRVPDAAPNIYYPA